MTHTERLIVLARRRNDIAALAILEGGRRFQPDPAPLRFVVRALTPLAECGKRPDLAVFHRVAA